MTNPTEALAAIISAATNLDSLETALFAFLDLPHMDQFATEAGHYRVELEIEESGFDPETYEPTYIQRLHVMLAADDNGDCGGEFRMGEGDINCDSICWYAVHAAEPIWDATAIATEIAGMVGGLLETRANNHEITTDQIEALKTEAGEAGDAEMVALCERALLGHEDGWVACADAIEDAANMDD